MGALTCLVSGLMSRPLLALARKRAAVCAGCDPLAAQREIFRSLIATAAETKFGKDHDFARLQGISFDAAYHFYRTNVPIRTYQQFMSDYFYHSMPKTDVGRVPPNLDNVTWPGTIRMYCETSGTTAPTKFIPFSDQMYAENRRAAFDMMACYLAAHPDSQLLNGKILYMSGSTNLNEVRNSVWSGDMSALTLRFRPWYVSPFVEPGPEISALPWDNKLEAMARLLLKDQRIRVISGVPPWIILLLKRCCEIGGKPLPDLLPNLELIIHGGTSMKPYHSQFNSLFDDHPPRLLELLPSSESFMGFQHAGEKLMRLTPFYGTFFEFVRFEDLDDDGKPSPDCPAIPLERVEIGRRYAVILSTCSGLWRYHIGDTLRFTSLNPHFIEFTGRDRFLDKLEEKVTQGEVEQAVGALNQSNQLLVREFMVGADVENRRHCWVLAVDDCRQSSQNAVRMLDGTLCSLNADYATFRQQGRIHEPEVRLVPVDGIYRWSRDERGKLGGQTKIPHIDPTHDSSLIASLCRYHFPTG